MEDPDSAATNRYTFAGWTLEPTERRLTNPQGIAVDLPPRALDTLTYLVERAGELVEKPALIRAVWGRSVVGDNSLDQIISLLRRRLRSDDGSPPMIRTERLRGHRFVASVARTAAARIDAHDPQSRTLLEQARPLVARPGASNLRGALELLDAAIALSPRFAPALAERALLRCLFPIFDVPMSAALTLAEQDARSALALMPGLARAHQALAYSLLARGRWVEAHDHIETACLLEPRPEAQVSRVWQITQSVGHLRRALEQAEDVARRLPYDPLGAIALGTSFVYLARDAEARQHLDRSEALGWPHDQAPLPDCRFILATRCGHHSEAIGHARSGLNAAMRDAGAAAALEELGDALLTPRARPAAITALQRILQIGVRGLGPLNQKRMLIWLVMLGAVDEGYDLLQAMLDDSAAEGAIGGPWGWLWLPELRAFRRSPRFRPLVGRFGYAGFWRQHGAPDGHVFRNEVLQVSESGERSRL